MEKEDEEGRPCLQHAGQERGNSHTPSSSDLHTDVSLKAGGEWNTFPLPDSLSDSLTGRGGDNHNAAAAAAAAAAEAVKVAPESTSARPPSTVAAAAVSLSADGAAALLSVEGLSRQEKQEQFKCKHDVMAEEHDSLSWCETDPDKPSLMAEQVPVEMRESYIHTGYRPPGIGVTVSAYSALYLHNETLNFWTHMLPCVYFAYLLFVDQGPWLRLSLISGLGRYPFYGYMFGICTLFGVSSFAHLFHCAGQRRWRNVCFVMDYAAISVYGMASAIAYYFYSRPRFRGTFIGYMLSGEGQFLGFTMAMTWVATYASCITRLRPTKFCYAIRTAAFALPFLTGSFPAIMRWLHAGAVLVGPPAVVVVNGTAGDFTDMTTGAAGVAAAAAGNTTPSVVMDTGMYRFPQLDYDFQTPYTRHLVMLAGGALINVIKVPERFWPGMFDTIGSSHQWFHILVFLSIREQFWLMLEEIACHSGILYARDPDSSMPWGRATIEQSPAGEAACTIVTSTASLPGPPVTTSWFYPWGWSWNSLLFCALGNPRASLDTWMALNTIAWMTILFSVLTITIVWFGYSYNFEFSASWCTPGSAVSDSADTGCCGSDSARPSSFITKVTPAEASPHTVNPRTDPQQRTSQQQHQQQHVLYDGHVRRRPQQPAVTVPSQGSG